MWDTVESQKITVNISIGIEIFLGVIGGLTLLIGGVGVANIMYAVVKHRTKEIGVQMALGARRSYVLGPLVLESLSLTALGGVIGIGVGVGLVRLLASCSRRPTATRWSSWARRPSRSPSRPPRCCCSARSASCRATSRRGAR